MRLCDHNLCEASFVKELAWYAEHGIARAVPCVKKAVGHIKAIVVPEVIEHLRAKRVFRIPLLHCI
jgi:hypothetical protein